MNTKTSVRQLLLDQGLQLVRVKGLRGLVVRELTSHAGANLGSFVYHFKTRERFLEEVVEQWYAPIYAQLQKSAVVVPGEDAVSNLERVFQDLILILNQHAGFITHVFADALAGEPAAQRFLLNMPDRHPRLLFELIVKAQMAGLLIAGPPLQLLGFLMSAVGLPMMLGAGLLAHCDWLPAEAAPARDWLSSAAGAQQRLHWALQGIRRHS
jgi:AcrR family transcriptional regulator